MKMNTLHVSQYLNPEQYRSIVHIYSTIKGNNK